MKILHLETSSKNCSVAISDNEELLCLCEEYSQDYKQSEKLHTFIEWVLEGAETTLKQLDAISLGKGPGSYTGLRIGAASAKGLCYGLNIPLLATNSLYTLAESFLDEGYDYIIPLVDARRMEVYTAIYEGKSGEIVSPTEALVLDEESFSQYRDKRILFVGDGAEKLENITYLSNAVYRSDVNPSAKYLIKKSVEKFNRQDFENIVYFEPFYLKDFHGVTKKSR